MSCIKKVKKGSQLGPRTCVEDTLLRYDASFEAFEEIHRKANLYNKYLEYVEWGLQSCAKISQLPKSSAFCMWDMYERENQHTILFGTIFCNSLEQNDLLWVKPNIIQRIIGCFCPRSKTWSASSMLVCLAWAMDPCVTLEQAKYYWPTLKETHHDWYYWICSTSYLILSRSYWNNKIVVIDSS